MSDAGTADPAAERRPSIEIVDYDPTWPVWFGSIRDRIAAALGPVAIAIEHVGSTSVPGLAAKPVIDIDVVVERVDIPAAIGRLESIGYVHLGTLGVPDREAFRRPPESVRHNLYVCPPDGEGLRNHLALRHHLRAHPDAVAAYGSLKRQLAAESDDIEVYVAGKTNLIVSFLRAEGIDEPTLASIEASNRPRTS